MMTSVLRTMFSAAWVVVLPIAGWISVRYSVFDVFVFAAMLTRPDAKLSPAARPLKVRSFGRVLPKARLVGIGGILALCTAIILHLTVPPLAMHAERLPRNLRQCRLTASLAAALEVPFMLGWGFPSARVAKETILILNAVIYALYLFAVVFAGTPERVLWLQIPNAVATATLVSLTISYMQDTIKGPQRWRSSISRMLGVSMKFAK